MAEDFSREVVEPSKGGWTLITVRFAGPCDRCGFWLYPLDQGLSDGRHLRHPYDCKATR